MINSYSLKPACILWASRYLVFIFPFSHPGAISQNPSSCQKKTVLGALEGQTPKSGGIRRALKLVDKGIGGVMILMEDKKEDKEKDRVIRKRESS
jgi:hypothetical protein